MPRNCRIYLLIFNHSNREATKKFQQTSRDALREAQKAPAQQHRVMLLMMKIDCLMRLHGMHTEFHVAITSMLADDNAPHNGTDTNTHFRFYELFL